MASISETEFSPARTLTILGCGTLGTAILLGLLTSLAEAEPSSGFTTEDGNSDRINGRIPTSAHNEEFQRPTQFIACVRSAASTKRLRKELSRFPQPVPVTILQNQNLEAVQAASTILLGCQPHDLSSCLANPAISQALRGKLLLSILAGVTISQIEAILHSSSSRPTAKTNGHANVKKEVTTIIRAMPNTAALVRSSMTIITSTETATAASLSLCNHLFMAIGTVTHIPASQFDPCTALCGSTPAFFALFLEGLLDGAVALGLKRREAVLMAAQTMKGAAALLLEGESTEQLKEKVCTPGGSTIQGLLELERKGVRGSAADALSRCCAANGTLG